MAVAVYVLCALTTLVCAWLLLRGYSRTRSALLLWSGLCFVGLTVSHVMLVVDLVIVPHYDFFPVRTGATLLSMALLLFGLIWKVE